MAVSAVWTLVYLLAPFPSEPKEQTAAHRRDALCPSTKIQKQAAFGISRPSAGDRSRLAGIGGQKMKRTQARLWTFAFKRKGVHPVFSHPSFQLPQRGRQITACRDWRSNNETDASSLGDVCFLIATFVQRMRPRAQLCKLTRSLPLSSPYGPTFGCSISTFPKGLDSVNPKNPAILSRERIGTDPPPRVDSFAPAHLALSGSLRESPDRLPKPPGSRETIWFGFISSQISQLEVGDGVAGECSMT